MLKIGLTGGIGCGKSTAVNAFHALGVSIIDADQISKDLVKVGSPVLVEISNAFGEDILSPNGELNRAKLKKIIFSDSEALDRLEAITHPRIKSEINRQLAASSTEPYVIVDIPLLVEKGYAGLFDRIIIVDCLPEQQIERVSHRDDLNTTIIESIIKKQLSREERLNSATDIINNTGKIKVLESQVKELHKSFLQPLS